MPAQPTPVDLFQSTHNLPFETAPWWLGGVAFRIGTCHGLWACTDEAYEIQAIINDQPGNGHLQDVFDWFENSAKRDGRDLHVTELMNKRFARHLVEKRGFSLSDDGNNAVKQIGYAKK